MHADPVRGTPHHDARALDAFRLDDQREVVRQRRRMRRLQARASGGQVADDAIHRSSWFEQDRPALEGALPWQLAAFFLHDEKGSVDAEGLGGHFKTVAR